MKLFLMLLLAASLSLAAAYRGRLVGIETGFAPVNLEIEGRSFSIRPVSKRSLIGSQFGFPVFEMDDQFFIVVSYKCSATLAGEIEVSKSFLVAGRSAKSESWGNCATIGHVRKIRFPGYSRKGAT